MQSRTGVPIRLAAWGGWAAEKSRRRTLREDDRGAAKRRRSSVRPNPFEDAMGVVRANRRGNRHNGHGGRSRFLNYISKGFFSQPGTPPYLQTRKDTSAGVDDDGRVRVLYACRTAPSCLSLPGRHHAPRKRRHPHPSSIVTPRTYSMLSMQCGREGRHRGRVLSHLGPPRRRVIQLRHEAPLQSGASNKGGCATAVEIEADGTFLHSSFCFDPDVVPSRFRPRHWRGRKLSWRSLPEAAEAAPGMAAYSAATWKG